MSKKKNENQIEESKTEDVKETETTESNETESNIIVPVAIWVKLRATHPQETYGRCGYRFNKKDAVRIAMNELPEGAAWTFEKDPYLELEYEA